MASCIDTEEIEYKKYIVDLIVRFAELQSKLETVMMTVSPQ